MRKISGLLGALMLAIGIVSCGGGGDTTGAGGGGGGGGGDGGGGGNCAASTFCMGSANFFTAAATTTLTVAAGTTVTWKNDSGVIHNVTWNDATGSAAAGAGDGSGNIADFGSGSHTRVFSTPGTYGFHCTIHAPGMTGSITVQ